MKLTMRVENVNEVVPALPLHCVFSQRGGIVGSGDEATWKLQDIDGSIPEAAARIVVVDQHFTIEALNDAKIFMNGATSGIAAGRPVILSDKDTIVLGLLNCRVETGANAAGADQQVTSMSKFAMDNSETNDALVIDGEYEEADVVKERQSGASQIDPIAALTAQQEQAGSVDPLEALDMHKTSGDMTTNQPTQSEARATDFDSDRSADAALNQKRVKKDQYGFEEIQDEWDDTSKSINRSQGASLDLDHPVDHVALRPLTRSLGLPLGNISAEQASDVLADIGGALRAAVGGMSEIYRSRDGLSNRFPLTTLHMHALEDNPLRFAEDTDEALHAMFAKRGVVHLSAPAAMQEAVDHFELHQTATEQAIDKALDAVLVALAPKALEKRFRSYAPGERPEGGEEQDAWCWGMYKAYFNELKSQRQRGLQMLFWEVFQHEYQGIMRNHELFGEEADDT